MPVRSTLSTVTLCILCATAFAPAVNPSSTTRTVSGRIVDAGTGKQLASVAVVAVGARVGSTSDASGTFAMTSVPSDVSKIDFRHPCFLPVQVTIAKDADVEIEIGLPFDQSSLQRPGCGGLGARRKE